MELVLVYSVLGMVYLTVGWIFQYAFKVDFSLQWKWFSERTWQTREFIEALVLLLWPAFVLAYMTVLVVACVLWLVHIIWNMLKALLRPVGIIISEIFD